MKGRSRAATPVKARRRKTVAPKRASASKAVPRRSSSAGDMEAKIGQLTIENARLVDELRQRTTGLSEALEQQKAASEVLEAIAAFRVIFSQCSHHAAERRPHLRRKVWKYLPLGRGTPCTSWLTLRRRPHSPRTQRHAASPRSENGYRPHGRD